MNEYIIYSYFNGEQIQAVLNAIVMMVGSGGTGGDYLGLVKTAGVIGLMLAVIYGFVRARAEDAGAYLVVMAIFYSILMLPRVEVTILEAATGPGAGATRTVANVPMGLALFASMTSRIGHWLTDRAETFFSYPDDSLKFAQHGLMGASRALREAHTASIPDPVNKQDMVNFMRDCINPELVANPAAISPLIRSVNIWNDFATLNLINPGRLVTLSGWSGAIQCSAAYANLTTTLNAQVASEQSRIARLLNPGLTPTDANTSFAAMLPIAEALVMTASVSAAEGIKQRMMINALNDSSGTMAQIMNDPAAAQQAVATAIATASANSSMRTLGHMAAEALPMIRNAIELVVYGVFPIVFVLIIIAGTKGGMVLRSYVMTMLWVQLWAPLYAILHFVAQSAGNKSLNAALESIDGVAVANSAAFINANLSAEAVAGVLTISVPIVALALIKGGEVAMSGIVSSTVGPVQQSASQAGSQVGQGNINAGNVNWGNYSSGNTTSHQSQLGPSYTSPNRVTNNGAWASETRDGRTGEVSGHTPNQFGGGTAAIASAQSRDNTENSGRTVTGTAGSSATLSNATSTGVAQTLSARTARTLGSSIANVFGGGVDMANAVTAAIGGWYEQKISSGSRNINSKAITGEAKGFAGMGLGGNPSDGGMPPASTSGQHAPNTSQAAVGPNGAIPGGGTPSAAQPTGGGSLPVPSGQPTGPASAVGAPPRTKTPADGSPAAQLANLLRSKIPSIGLSGSVTGRKAQTEQNDMGHGASSTSAQKLEDGYKRALTAMDKAVGNISDAGQREAAKAFRNDFARQAQAVITTGHTLQDSQTAGNQRTETSSNDMRVASTSGKPVYDAMSAILGTTDSDKIGRAMHEPAMMAAATAYAQNKLAAAASTHLSSGGVKAPKPIDQVKGEEEGKLGATGVAARAAVDSGQEANATEVTSAMHKAPESKPNLLPAAQRAAEIMEGVAEGLGSAERQANFNKGALMAAEHVYGKLTSPNFDSFMGGLINSGARPTADQARQIVANLAESSPSFRDALVKAGGDGALTGGAQSYVETKALGEWTRMTAPTTWREHVQKRGNDWDARNY